MVPIVCYIEFLVSLQRVFRIHVVDFRGREGCHQDLHNILETKRVPATRTNFFLFIMGDRVGDSEWFRDEVLGANS